MASRCGGLSGPPCQASQQTWGGGWKLIVPILRSLGSRDREGARCEESRIGSSHQGKSLRAGKEAPREGFFTELKPAGVWCSQCCNGKQGPAKMGVAAGEARLAGPWLIWGLVLLLLRAERRLWRRRLCGVAGTEESVWSLCSQESEEEAWRGQAGWDA